MITSNTASSFTFSSAALGAALLPIISPIIEPLAKNILGGTVEHIQNVINGTDCPVGCKGPWALPCRVHRTASICKQTCQTRK